MKFEDIKCFTAEGHYWVTVDVKHLEKMLDDYKEWYNLQLNPDFQRGNVWTREQQIAYLEFFFRGGNTGRNIYFNCPAFGRHTEESNIREMVCVDGLQRLTAMLGFLHNEIPIFDGNYCKDFDKIPFGKYCFQFNVNDLLTRKEVLQWYIEMNSGGTPHSKEEIDRVKKLLDEA